MTNARSELLKNTRLFLHYSDREIEDIAKELVLEKFHAGEIILTEGEIGDRLHVIFSGSARVYTYVDQAEITLARLEKGDFFGEQALLAERPTRRNATVMAITDVETGSLTYQDFQKHLKKDSALAKMLFELGQNELINNFLQKTKENSQNDSELRSLFQQIVSYNDREVFFRQGDEPKSAYLLLSGSVEIRIYDETRRLKSHTMIFPGQFFGELGVIEQKPRAGTAVSSGESKVAVIPGNLIERLSKKNKTLGELISAGMALYEIPSFGLATQYSGIFQQKTVLYTTFRKNNGQVLTVARMIHSNVISFFYTEIQKDKEVAFQDAPDHSRTLLLTNNRLIGVVSIGIWDDLAEVFGYVKEKSIITEKALATFQETGKLHASTSLTLKEGILCECMQVKTEAIKKLISEGITTLKEISKITGAGTVCGGCKPFILELTGCDVWTYVKISQVKKHNESVRSYQFQPLSGKLSPYKPGQHLVVSANIDGLWVSRSYTLTDYNEEKNYYEVTVKQEPLGYFSRWLFDHDQAPISIRVSAPQGEFIFDREANNPAICFMAGIGITPFIAFARNLSQIRSGRKLHLDYSIRNESEITFQQEIVDWPKNFSNISAHIHITGRKEKNERLDENQIRALIHQFPQAEIFICGPKSYEQFIKESVEKIGIPKDIIHIEEFVHAGESTKK
jgi:ferredoxin-NADP reductase/CRP-like cAMP-binding protein/bacterioferritin-associated ferredoxin